MQNNPFGDDPMPMDAGSAEAPMNDNDSMIAEMLADESVTPSGVTPSFDGPAVEPAPEQAAPANVAAPEAVAPAPEAVAPAPEPVVPVQEPAAPAPGPVAQAPVEPVAPVAPVAAAPVQEVGVEKPKKGSSHVVLIIILVIFALAAIVATGFVAYNMGRNDGMASRKSNSGTGYSEEKKDSDTDDEEKDDDSDADENEKDSEDDKKVSQKKNDATRKDDLGRMIASVGDYQSNNNGRIPFGGTSTPKSIATFINRYIDKTCEGEDPMALECKGNDFRDPEGDVYKMKEVGEIADTDVNVSREIASEKTFYVFYNASCGEKEGRADGDARASRDVAIFMKLSDGTIVCEDNQ